MSRALFIANPQIAITWNPMLNPMPVVPQVDLETVLASLLRIYAIRRDVTAYFRAIWRPVLPSTLELLKESDSNDSIFFSNVWAVANRFLECTLSDKSMVVFPPIATAICRATHEVGDFEALHYYLLNLLILPNLLKILSGDHESVENEDIYRTENIENICNKYFDNSLWLPIDLYNVETGIIRNNADNESKSSANMNNHKNLQKNYTILQKLYTTLQNSTTLRNFYTI
jgi:hypothetical protein